MRSDGGIRARRLHRLERNRCHQRRGDEPDTASADPRTGAPGDEDHRCACDAVSTCGAGVGVLQMELAEPIGFRV